MMQTLKRLLAMTLCAVMLLGVIPATAFAEDLPTEEPQATQAPETMPEETDPVEEPSTEPASTEEEGIALLAEGNQSSGTPDSTPPVLKSLKLSATHMENDGSIEVIAEATDDVSGVNGIYVYFYCEETGKSLSCGLSDSYYDETEWKYVKYEDGAFHGKITTGQYALGGTFVISRVEVYDKAGNWAYYYPNNSDPENLKRPIMPEEIKNLQFTVGSSETPDTTPPVLKSLILSATHMENDGSIEVIGEAADDVSGVNGIYVYFYCEETGKSLSCGLSDSYYDETEWKYVKYEDGTFRGKITTGQYALGGTFVISRVEVYDKAGNWAYYYPNNSDPENLKRPIMPEEIKNLQFTVGDSKTPDITPPVLKSLKLATDTMAAPGSIEVIGEAADDVSGVNGIYVYFYCEETGKSLSCGLSDSYYDETEWKYVKYEDGTFRGKITTGQYALGGTFVISRVEVYDKAGNWAYYYPNNSDPENLKRPIMPEEIKNLKITVLTSTPDVTTSVSNSEFVDLIDQAEDNAYIVADYSGETTMPAETFEAIAGTNKTLDLVSEGVTWRFNGEDIVNDSKPIDLNVQITKVDEESSSSGQQIQEKLDETPGVVMKFAENGQLPGKATIQIKVDYAMREYLGSGKKLCVYYFNNQTGQLELVADELMVINDTYVEFSITHCSYYVLTTDQDLEDNQNGDSIAMYRMFNPNTGEHFYTGSAKEKRDLVKAGWNYEGIAWNAPVSGGTPIHRLFNPNSGDHHYTGSMEEVENLVAVGWQYEGVAFNSASSTQLPQYRMYNPNADLGSHHYTGSTEERDFLVSVGWKYEGIGWYGMP